MTETFVRESLGTKRSVIPRHLNHRRTAVAGTLAGVALIQRTPHVPDRPMFRGRHCRVGTPPHACQAYGHGQNPVQQTKLYGVRRPIRLYLRPLQRMPRPWRAL
jgi:hypothetical protein